MTYFECPTQEQDYLAWTNAHRLGRPAVLVRIPGKRFRLHSNIFCEHIFDTTATGHVAKGGRWCFDTEHEALAFARRESGRLPERCHGFCEG